MEGTGPVRAGNASGGRTGGFGDRGTVGGPDAVEIGTPQRGGETELAVVHQGEGRHRARCHSHRQPVTHVHGGSQRGAGAGALRLGQLAAFAGRWRTAAKAAFPELPARLRFWDRFFASPLAAQHKAGKIRLLAVSGNTRSPLVPDVPTLREAGVNVSIVNGAGLFGPARLPRDIAERMHAALAVMMAKQENLDRLATQGMAPQFQNAAQLAAFLSDERKRYEQLVKASGYVPESA